MGEALAAGFGAFGRCYEATTLLKSGLGVQTFLGRDLRNGDPVVIKQTRASNIPPGAQLRLEHEAEVLRELAASGVAPLLDVGRDGDSFYLVMPFVEGVTLAERIARCGALSVLDTLAVGRGLMRALQAAHDQGVLHRDVTPSNVIVGSGSPPERVTLIDFGLARSARLDAPLRDVPVGTVGYVSPEQAGLIHCEIGERSDLYSSGIVLFECLAGRPPFVGATVGEILRQHLTAKPARLDERAAVPRSLEDVVQHLLEKDPRDRYQSAAAVLADLDEIAMGLERGVREPAVVVGEHDLRRTLTEPAFVGRDEELRAFEEELSRALGGESVLLLVDGESGVGKTRMLDHAAVTARRRGAWVLRGSSTDAATQRPLQVLAGIAQEIVAAARQDPGFADALRSRLGEHVETLCGALPALAELLSPGTPVSPGPEQHGEARTVAALAALVDALGAPSRPAVILLDDCQWLDDLSLKLLLHWHRARDAEQRAAAVLLVAAYRGDEVPPHSPLRQLAAPVISLGPLAAEDVRRMAESMAGALPAEAVQLVQRLSEGNPFLVAAVVEGLVEGGALVDGGHGWELEPGAMARAQSSRRWAAFLAQRLEKVPPPALELLSVGAVLGRSFELKLAADLAGQSVTGAMAGVAQARRRRLVWIDSQGSRCTFVHDRLREAVLERLAPAARRTLHERAAAALERDEPARPDREFDLAYHFDSAGDHVRALPHALSAASRARAQYALEVAEHYYRIAERGAGHETVSADTRRQVAEALGDVLLMRGRYDDAGAYLSRARAIATSPMTQAAIDAKTGELAFKRGDVRAAADALERALPLLGRRVPRSPAAMAAATLLLVLVQLAHMLLPRRLVARRRLEDGEADLLAARIFSRLAYANWFLRGQMATFWAHLSELNLAERYPPTRELAQACSEHSISVTGLPRIFFRRGVRYAERGLAIRRALGDVWGQGQSLNFYGMLLYAFGRYEEALDRFREALRLLRSTGDRWEANVAAAHIAFCHYRLGALREAVAECRRVHHDGLEIGDRHATAIVLEVWSKATGGAVPADLVEAARGSGGDPLSHEVLLQAEAVRAIGAGRPAEAAIAFASAEEVARSAHLKNEYVSYIPIWIARARRLCAAQAAIETGVLVPERLRDAEAAVRRGLRCARRHRGNLPMALRERALLRAMRGRARAARRDLDASLAEADRQGARFEKAQTLLARGELGRLFGWPGAGAEAGGARSALREMGAEFACSPMHVLPPEDAHVAPVTLSLADRFASIVDQGRRIASALTPADVHAALCDAASVLLRGQANLVLAAGDGEPRVLTSRGGPAEFSRSLVERALREGRPIAFTELLEAPLPKSLVLPSPRSVLCAPIVVGGLPAGCLYVTHALVGDLFREEEKQLAGYLVTLAGASLEKAQAFASVQDLSRTLLDANAELDANLRRLRAAQEEIVQAAKMATVGTLVAGLSHELNNPLSAILGYAHTTLKRTADDHPARPALLAIQRQAKRCADLVRTLLDFSHKGPLELEETTIEDLVRHVAALASLKMRRQDARLEIDMPPPGTCSVRVSRTQMESALLNLVLNAVDASPVGGVVGIEAVPCERDGRPGVEVRVRDHGTGIDPDVLPRVFDPFFTTKPAGIGTGLGLSLSRRFVEGHEGHLWIESRVGEGTTVRIWLPRCESTWPSVGRGEASRPEVGDGSA